MLHNKTQNGSKNIDEYFEEEEHSKSEIKPCNILNNDDPVEAASERKIEEEYIEYDDKKTDVKEY